MRVLRYILQNPMKAGLEDRPGTYRWSSYQAYVKGEGRLTYTELAKELFGSLEAVIRFVQESNDDLVMDEENYDRRLKEDWAKKVMINITNCRSVPEFQALDMDLQKAYVLELHRAHIPIRTISRITGMTKTTIGRVVKPQETASGGGEGQMAEPGALYDPQADDFTLSFDPSDESIVW